MKKILCLLCVFASIALKAQFLPTDSLNFCEDSTTHNYMKYGNVTVGSYSCSTNKSIRIGNGTGADSVVFNLAVTANTDSIKLEIVMPWRGGTKNPKVWVENFRNDTVPYMGVGNCVPVFIKMGGLASRTNDGSIKVKLMDTIPGFTMDGQFTYIKAYSKFVSTTGVSEKNLSDHPLEIYPNPSTGIFHIKSSSSATDLIVVYNALGVEVFSGEIKEDRDLDLQSMKPGIYILRIGKITRKLVIE
jgi:hypothetical protein